MARLLLLCLCLVSYAAFAQTVDAPAHAKKTTEQLVTKLSPHLAKIYVDLPGTSGTGSGVVVGENRVVTNCHVVKNAISAELDIQGKRYAVTGLIPDWEHDVCLLTVDGLSAASVSIASSAQLQYAQTVYSMGFADTQSRPNAYYGHVKGLYTLDNSVVVRTTCHFQRGDSGGGVFNEAGQLVALIAVKSPGSQPNYYNMSVAWVKSLLDKTAMPLQVKAKPAFWAKGYAQWPYFMKVVQPYKTKSWANLAAIAEKWLVQEPNNIEAIYYRAVAAFEMHDMRMAERQFNQVIARHQLHSEAVYYLGLIAAEQGNRAQANATLASLATMDGDHAVKLRQQMPL